jgi:TPR repeat protein
MRNETHDQGHSRQQLSIWSVMALIIITFIIAAGLYFLFENQDQFQPPGQANIAQQPTAEVTQHKQENLGRSIIAKLKTQQQKPDLDDVFRQAETFILKGQLEDAHLLLFYAARLGHPMSARTLGSMYDPNHHNASTSLMDEPDLAQSYKWYKIAADAGDPVALERLSELKILVELAASSGDEEAKMLLLNWN